MFLKEQIEFLHNTGKMPDWVYYQQNRNGITENYREQKTKIHQKTKQERKGNQQEKELEDYIQKDIEEIVQKSINEVLQNIRLE